MGTVGTLTNGGNMIITTIYDNDWDHGAWAPWRL